MLYKLFIYKTSVHTASAPAIDICNRVVSTWPPYALAENDIHHFMLDFDIGTTAERLRSLLGDKCRIYIRALQAASREIGYLCIATSYAQAPAVLPYVHCVAAENDLVLYDFETGKTFYRKLVDKALLAVRIRVEDYKRAIFAQVGPVWKIRKIRAFAIHQQYERAYIVTLRKDTKKSFTERCEDFYRCLLSQLREDEQLELDNACFTIVGDGYSICFCLEGYKKSPNHIGYYQDGSPRAEIINRMGCEAGFLWLKQSGKSLDDVLARMNFTEMERAYPNPADRFAASVNITKWEAKQALGVSYRGIGTYGSEILFHVVPDDYCEDSGNISVLAIDEGYADPILSIVQKFHPYFAERYYLTENHLPTQLWREIVEAVKEQKQILLETCRYDEAKLTDIFIRWSEAQLDLYEHCGNRMLNIQGP